MPTLQHAIRHQLAASALPSAGSGKISLELCLVDGETERPVPVPSCWPLPCDPVVPDRLKLREAAAGPPPGRAATSNKLCRQLPNRALAFHDPLDDVVLSLAELPCSSLTTLRGFSSAFRMYLIRGRRAGFGLRQDRAMIAIAHTSSRRSSYMTSDGSMMFVTSSLSYILMYGKVFSSHSFVMESVDELMPSLPVTSSSRTFPKQYTS